MVRSDLAKMLVDELSLSGADAAEAVDAFFEAIVHSLRKGEHVEIRGFGSFHVRRYRGYKGRNPKTGEQIAVKPKRGVHFRPGKELRERVEASSTSHPLVAQTAEPTKAPGK